MILYIHIFILIYPYLHSSLCSNLHVFILSYVHTLISLPSSYLHLFIYSNLYYLHIYIYSYIQILTSSYPQKILPVHLQFTWLLSLAKEFVVSLLSTCTKQPTVHFYWLDNEVDDIPIYVYFRKDWRLMEASTNVFYRVLCKY